MASMATKHTRLMRRGEVYYFRCKIPADLVGHYGKREIQESLRTRDEREALRLVRARSEAQEQEFDRVRAGRTVTELTDEQVQSIAHEHYVNTLLVDEMSRERGLTEDQYEALEVGIDEGENLLGDALPVGDISQVEHIVDASLKRHGITLQKDSRVAEGGGCEEIQPGGRESGGGANCGYFLKCESSHPHPMASATAPAAFAERSSG